MEDDFVVETMEGDVIRRGTPNDLYVSVVDASFVTGARKDAPLPDPPAELPDGWKPTTDMVLHPEKYSAEDLAKLVHAMRDDWRTINEIYNERARMYNWCDIYESNQALYNERLRVLALTGRPGMRGKPEFSWTGSDRALYQKTVL